MRPHLKFLSGGDVSQSLAGVPLGFGMRFVVKDLDEMLIRGGRLTERSELDEADGEVRFGRQWSDRMVTQMALIDH